MLVLAPSSWQKEVDQLKEMILGKLHSDSIELPKATSTNFRMYIVDQDILSIIANCYNAKCIRENLALLFFNDRKNLLSFMLN